MPLDVVGTFTLGEVNVGASLAASAMIPMAAQLDAAMFGPVGLSSYQAEVQGSLNANLGVSAQLQLTLSNPIASYQAALASITQLVATIQTALAAGAPTIGVEINTQLSTSMSASAALAGKVAAVKATIEAATLAKNAGFQVVSNLQASLSAGGVGLLSFGYSGSITLQEVGSQAAATFGTGIPGILPTDSVSGVLFITKNPAAAAAISALFKVGT